MFHRQKSGSELCSSCGKLVGVRDDVCWNCGRRNPGLWGVSDEATSKRLHRPICHYYVYRLLALPAELDHFDLYPVL